jgi:uncharacterized protein (UPF0332 family)
MPEAWESYLAKARESLRVAESACSRGHCNCAANRAYYAAYLAELAAVQKLVPQRPTARGGFQHHSVVNSFNAHLVRRRQDFEPTVIEDVNYLESLRIKADYKPEHVTKAEATECFNKSRRIVARIRSKLEEQ